MGKKADTKDAVDFKALSDSVQSTGDEVIRIITAAAEEGRSVATLNDDEKRSHDKAQAAYELALTKYDTAKDLASRSVDDEDDEDEVVDDGKTKPRNPARPKSEQRSLISPTEEQRTNSRDSGSGNLITDDPDIMAVLNSDEYRDAYINDYMLHQRSDSCQELLSDFSDRAVLTYDYGTGASAGVLAPGDIVGPYVEKLKVQDAINVWDVQTSDNYNTKVIYQNTEVPTATVGQENVEVTETDPAWETLHCKIYPVSLSIPYTDQIVNTARNSGTDLLNILSKTASTALTRKIGQLFVTGGGEVASPNEPLGALTALRYGVAEEHSQPIAYECVDPATDSAEPGKYDVNHKLCYDTIVSIINEQSNDFQAYIGEGSEFVLSNQAVQAFQEIRYSTGQPLIDPVVQAGQTNTLRNYPYKVLPSLNHSVEASTPYGIFGDLKELQTVYLCGGLTQEFWRLPLEARTYMIFRSYVGCVVKDPRAARLLVAAPSA